MYTIFVYDKPFYITGNTSSNAFSFEKRTHPKLYVPSVIEGGLSDVKEGEKVAFEDYDEFGKLRSAKA